MKTLGWEVREPQPRVCLVGHAVRGVPALGDARLPPRAGVSLGCSSSAPTSPLEMTNKTRNNCF